MKRLIYILLTLGALCSLAGCQETGLSRPDFPLEEQVVNAALEQSGLPGAISKDETQSYAEWHTIYTLRDEDQVLPIAIISSSLREGERLFQIDFISPPLSAGPAFAWEDWKQQLVFSTLLYGGFADAEQVYRAFSEQEVSEGKLPPYEDRELAEIIAERYKWDASLPTGYCRIDYELFNSIENGIENDPLDARVVAQSPRMHITMYESKAHYEKEQQDMLERKEDFESSRVEAPN